MYSNSKEKKKGQTKLFEEFWMEYHQFKDYIETATEEQKDTPYYKHRLNIVEAIQGLYPIFDKDFQTIVDMRYWNENGQCNWAEVADELFMSVSGVQRKRDTLIQQFSKEIGWV